MDNLFARNLKYLRGFHRLGQGEVATELGLTRPAISNYERGESFPDYDKIIYFAKKYRVNIDDLFRRDLSEKYDPTDHVTHNTETAIKEMIQGVRDKIEAERVRADSRLADAISGNEYRDNEIRNLKGEVRTLKKSVKELFEIVTPESDGKE